MRLTLEAIDKQVDGAPQLYPLDLSLEPGQINVLLGQTGAGKTTLMRLMAGLDRPSHGRILADGVDVTGVPVRRRNLAMVYQQFVNYPSFTVFDNIASPLRLARRFPPDEIRRRVTAMAEKLHIAHLLDRLPGELSGGQQQRTAIARALVKEAGLLLLDEPLANLDYKLREELRSELKHLFADSQTTVVYGTAEPQEALLLGGQTIVLDQGRLLQAGPTLALFHHPASLRVAAVFSDPPMNLLPVTLPPAAAQAEFGATVRIPLAPHLAKLAAGNYTFGVRPCHVRLRVDEGALCEVAAEVELAEIIGSETYLHARHAEWMLVAQLPGVHALTLGSRVTLAFDPAEVFAFDATGRLAASPIRMMAGEGFTRSG